MNYPVLLLFVSVILGITGQFLFKVGLNKLGGNVELSWQVVKLFFTPYIGAGITCYGLSTCVWLAALSRVPLSSAYPVLATGYLLIFLISVLFLGEKFTHLKLLANLLIVVGITLLFWGKE